MKNSLFMATCLSAILLITGCATKQDVEQTQATVPYSVFEKGQIISVQKVLIDGSYETFMDYNSVGRTKTTGETTLYKTVIFYNDKSYTLFFGNELKTGSSIEFIFKNGQMTKIQVP